MSDQVTVPSSYRLPDRPAPVRPVFESPAIDAIGRGFALTTSTAPIVHLSGARARLLGLSAAERRHVILLTEGSARLTPAMHETLSMLGGTWVVHTESGLRLVSNGQRIERIEDAVPGAASATGDGQDAPQPQPAPEHADIGVAESDLHEILVVSATVRHRNVAAAPFGASLRLVAEAMLGEAALDWGVREPALAPWEGDEVAEFFRERADRGPAIVVAGSGEDGRLAVGQVRIRPRRVGAEESYTLRVDLGPAGEAATTERWLAATEALTELPEIGLPLYTSVMAEFGTDDLSIWPWFRPPPIPVAMLIGAAGVARFSLARNRSILEEHFAVEFVGSARRPSLVAELGERPHPDNVTELAALLGAIGADAVAAGLGAAMPSAMFGGEWRAFIARAATERLGDELMAELTGADAADGAEPGVDGADPDEDGDGMDPAESGAASVDVRDDDAPRASAPQTGATRAVAATEEVPDAV
ncbi:MAG: DUF6177 family protein [Pseudoclavibacter sp.]